MGKARLQLTKEDRIEKALFLPKHEAEKMLSQCEYRIMKRWMAIHSYMLSNPSATDRQAVDFISNHSDPDIQAERSTIYNDIKKVSAILGNMNNISKEWNKYVIVELNKEQIQLALGNIKDLMTRRTDPETNQVHLQMDDHQVIANYQKIINKCSDTIGKYLRLDQEQVEKLVWEELKPADFETTTDISVLEGFDQNLDGDKKARLRREFLDNVTDAEIV